jgi:endoglucanase
VSEFGTCNDAPTCVSDAAGTGPWFESFRHYLADADVDWAYWPISGTQSSGYGRTHGAPESYGVLDPTWTDRASAELLAALQAMQPITQQP